MTTLPRVTVMVVVALLMVACTSAPRPTAAPSAASSPPPSAMPTAAASPTSVGLNTQQPDLPWQYADIDQPHDVMSFPTPPPGGVLCHPCHYIAEDLLFAVTQWSGGLISVGLIQPPVKPLAFTSNDGTSWQQVQGLTSREDAHPNGVVSKGQQIVLVGFEHNGATAWIFDGTRWQQAPEQDSLHVDYAAGAMNAAVNFDGQWVAGGFADDPLNDKAYAAAWRSTDGMTWTRDDDKGVFDGGRIWSMATSGDTIVAVGTRGDDIYGPAGAWRWTAATGWQSATFAPDNGGAMASVTTTPDGGYIAVGKNAQDLGAAVWTSKDGSSWQAVPDQPAFHYYLQPLRMQSIISTPDGYFVGGWRSDVAKGSAVLWRSADGQTWGDHEWQTTFSGGESTGVALIGDRAVMVGRTGYPDWNRATIWTRPWPY